MYRWGGLHTIKCTYSYSMWLIEQRLKQWVCRQVTERFLLLIKMKMRAHWVSRFWGLWQPVVNLCLLSSPGCESITYIGASWCTTKKIRPDHGRASRFSRLLHTHAGRRSNGRGAAVTSGGSHSMNHGSYFLFYLCCFVISYTPLIDTINIYIPRLWNLYALPQSFIACSTFISKCIVDGGFNRRLEF